MFPDTNLTVSVNGSNATITVPRVPGNEQLTFEFAFPVTAAKVVTDISIVSQPSRLEYTHGELLNLSGLQVMLTYNDLTTDNVALASFGQYGITTNPVNGTPLIRSLPPPTGFVHNGSVVEVKHNSQPYIYTDPLIVNQAAGAIVSKPVRNSVHISNNANNLFVNAVTFGTNPGSQIAEYAIGQSSQNPSSVWQTSTAFYNLNAGETYYVFARSEENDNFRAGKQKYSDPIRFFTVEFNGNTQTGGSPPAKLIVFDDYSITISARPLGLVKTAHIFYSWNTEVNGAGIDYMPGQLFRPVENTTLYAKWLPEQIYRFTIDLANNNLPKTSDIKISRSAVGFPQIGEFIVENISYFNGGITWRSGLTPIGSGSRLIVNATNIFYYENRIYEVTAVGKNDGIDYEQSVSFEVVD
jgi:hypothetical protein